MRSIASKVRFIALLLSILTVQLALCGGPPDTVVVPLVRTSGYGPFKGVARLSFPGEYGPEWQRALAEVRGIPFDLHGFSLRYMNLQMDQYLYQSMRSGLLDRPFALSKLAEGGYDTTRLTPKYVSQDVPIVAGYDKDGNIVYVVDTKDDHSFWGKDRIVILPYRPGDLTDVQMDSLNDRLDKPAVSFEFFDGKKSHEGEVALRINPYVRVPASLEQEYRGKIVFGIGTYEHRQGVLKSGERKYLVAASNGFQTGVYRGKESEFAFFPAEDSGMVSPATSLRYRLGDRIEITDEVFRIDSSALDGSSLTLLRVQAGPTGGGIAVGSSARDFRGRTLAGENVTLGQFRGKFVLLYFWYPGSALCASEIPYLNDIHAGYGGGPKLQVLGMALTSGPPLASFVSEHGVKWPQVPLSDTSGILRDYAVGGYPSVFLVDPQGKIVSNLRLGEGELSSAVALALGDSASFQSVVAKGNAEFRYDLTKKKRVEVAGDFSGWRSIPLYRSGGGFSRRVEIPPGRYHYKFIVDGQWKLDPANSDTENNASGEAENVLVVR